MTFDFVLLAGVACHFNPELQADPLDPPLCGDLEIFANGGGLSDLSPHFMEWSEALRRLRVQDWWWSGCRWLENMHFMAPWHRHYLACNHSGIIHYTLHSTPINTSHQTHHTYFATRDERWRLKTDGKVGCWVTRL